MTWPVPQPPLCGSTGGRPLLRLVFATASPRSEMLHGAGSRAGGSVNEAAAGRVQPVGTRHRAAAFALVWCLQVACDDKERQSQDAQHWVDANASEGSATHADESDAGASAEPVRVQVFSRTQGYRHESIAAGLAMFETFDQQEDLSVQSTEDPVRLVERLSETDVVVFLSTT